MSERSEHTGHTGDGARIRPGESTPEARVARDDNLRLDYQVTIDMVKVLTDIRFRCLVFVTAIITVASALLPGTGDPGTRAAFGIVGFLATLGIAVYELRNSQLYESAIHRAKQIERALGMATTTSLGVQHGLFNERPLYVNRHDSANLSLAQQKEGVGLGQIRLMRFWFVRVKHDQGLACIYGAALGGWGYLTAYGMLSLPSPVGFLSPWPAGTIRLISALIGLAVLVRSAREFARHDDTRYKLN